MIQQNEEKDNHKASSGMDTLISEISGIGRNEEKRVTVTSLEGERVTVASLNSLIRRLDKHLQSIFQKSPTLKAKFEKDLLRPETFTEEDFHMNFDEHSAFTDKFEGRTEDG
mgnify:CR=1 FL=1